jgi:hypothetical protein
MTTNPKPVSAEELPGETFTDRCRRLLTDQPKQREFTVSRVGLETLVLDSERYGEANAKAVKQAIADQETQP